MTWKRQSVSKLLCSPLLQHVGVLLLRHGRGLTSPLSPLLLCARRQPLLCVSLERIPQLNALLACRCGSCGGSDDGPCNGGNAELPPNGPGQALLLASETLWLAGVALALALILGLAIAATLIWHREVLIRRCSLPGELGSLTAVRGGSGVPSDSVDLKLELDGKGEPLLLGQGSFAKVSLMGRPNDRCGHVATVAYMP